MNSITFFLFFIPVLASLLLGINLIFAPHNPYQEKSSTFECGFHSFLGQNRTQFSISFFVFALLFLVFDLELVMILPGFIAIYIISHYGISIMMIFLTILAIGFVFEIGKNALKIDSRQYSGHMIMSSVLNASAIIWAVHSFITSIAIVIVNIIGNVIFISMKLRTYMSVFADKIYFYALSVLDVMPSILFDLVVYIIITVPIILGLTLSISFENFITLTMTLFWIVIYTMWRLPWQSMYFIDKYVCSGWYIIYILYFVTAIILLSNIYDLSIINELTLNYISTIGDENFLRVNFKDISNLGNDKGSNGDPNKDPGGDPKKPWWVIAAAPIYRDENNRIIRRDLSRTYLWNNTFGPGTAMYNSQPPADSTPPANNAAPGTEPGPYWGGGPRYPGPIVRQPHWSDEEYNWWRDLRLEQVRGWLESHGMTVNSAHEQEIEELDEQERRRRARARRNANSRGPLKDLGPNFGGRKGPGGGAGGSAGGTAGATAVH